MPTLNMASLGLRAAEPRPEPGVFGSGCRDSAIPTVNMAAAQLQRGAGLRGERVT